MPVALPVNVQAFATPYENLWDALIKVIRFDLLMPVDFADAKRGQFVTKQITEESSNQPLRFRITGRVEPGQNGLIVTLYKDQQVFKENRWVTTPSDLILEQQIFKLLKNELAGH